MDYHTLLWKEGMLLQPAHFQTAAYLQKNHCTELARTLNPYFWGIKHYQINQDALAQGRIWLQQALIIFASGQIIEIEGIDDVSFQADSTNIGKTIYIVFDRKKDWHEVCIDGIFFLKPQVKLSLDIQQGKESIALTRIVNIDSDLNVFLDLNYIASTPRLCKSHSFYQNINTLLTLIINLQENTKTPILQHIIANLYLIKIANSSLPLDIYKYLISCLALLKQFDHSPYNHNDLNQSLRLPFKQLQECINRKYSGLHQITLYISDNLSCFKLSVNHQKNIRLVLQIKSNTISIDKIKISSKATLPNIIKRALPGLPITPCSTPSEFNNNDPTKLYYEIELPKQAHENSIEYAIAAPDQYSLESIKLWELER